MLKNYLDKKISITRQKYLGTYKDTKKRQIKLMQAETSYVSANKI